jgi:hypothetical protein
MGKKKKVTQQEEEYKPKKRCAAEGCGNRKQVGEYCLSCYYCNNKPIKTQKRE